MNCDHLQVSIRGIVRAWDKKTGSRRISGHCENCQRDVERDDFPKEIEQPEWEEAQVA